MSALRTRPSVDKAICRRDLASPDLWDRSLQRSRERRRIAEIHRRTAPRRKGVSLAVSAALLASPVVPRFASAHSGSGAGTPTEDTGGGPAAGRAPRLLERGDTSPAVEQVQRALGVTADGIFGPITEGAVKRFQGHEGLPRTGRVDPATWMKLFSGNVTVLEAGTPEAQAIQTAAGDDPTPAAAASPSSVRGESATPAAAPASFQPAQDESATKSSRDEPRGDRDSTDERREPRRTRRASSDDRDRTPSSRSEQTGGDRDRGSTRPASDKREDPAPPSTPAPSGNGGGGGGGGGGGSCDGDFARPVDGTVTGVFGENRGGRSHEGMDIAAPSGTPIKAATCGRISEAGYQGGYGNIICIRASESFTTCYAHMSRFGASVGEYVKIGEVIGYVGCTGSCTGPHVHFEVRLNGQKVDPAPYINGSRKAPTARSSSTMAVSFTDSTRKTHEARALKREQASRQHDEAAKDPAQQPQISTAATDGEAGQAASGAPTGQAAPTAASIDEPAAAADPSTQAPGQETDPSAGVVEDTTGAAEDTTGQEAPSIDTGSAEETAGSTVEETTSTVEETTGTETPGTDEGAVDETTSTVEEDASSAVEETTGTDAPGTDTGAVDETTSNAEEDASSAVEETTGTDAPGTDTGAVDETTSNAEEDASSAVEETTSNAQEDASSAVEETTSNAQEDASSAVEETTGAVEEARGSSDEESDAPGNDDSGTASDAGSSSDASGEDGSDTASDAGSSSDGSGEDGSGSEEPAGATAGG